MQIRLHVTDADVRYCARPYQDAEYVLPTGACPHCGAADWHVVGTAPKEAHSTITAEASALCCRTPVGLLVVTIPTIFGLEEDRRVLVHGRCRVY